MEQGKSAETALKVHIDDQDLAYDFYERMYAIRCVEEKLLTLYAQAELRGTIHTCLGQEACAVGVLYAVDCRRDIVFSNHRGHGHFIAYCDDVEGLVAELMGKASGVCQGVGGSQHLHKANFYSNGIQGGMVPCAVGAALAEKEKRSGAIVVVFIGDGTFGQGVLYESLNIASLWSLPILFVVEDNKYAQSTPVHMHLAGSMVYRAQAFGIECAELTVTNPFEVYKIASQLVEATRQQLRPHFLVLHTYRLGPHSKGDDTRPREEIEQYLCQDPLRKLRDALDNTKCQQIMHRVEHRVDMAISKAKAAPLMPLSDFLERVGIESYISAKSTTRPR